MKISLLMIVCNEEARMRAGASVASVRGVVDEVVIVVQESKDNTLELSRACADVVIEHPCHGLQEPSRRDGIAACSGEWILSLDADEDLTPWGASMLREWCSQGIDLFRLRRLTTIGGRVFEDMPHPRLYRKGRVSVPDVNHSTPEILPGGTSRIVNEQAVISQVKSWDEQIADNRRYSKLRGEPADWSEAPRAFRPDTFDAALWDSINISNEYRLPADMTGQVVIDIGGHIGSFAHACLVRGAKFVVSVEPNPASFNCLQKNLARFGARALCLRNAAWRSDDVDGLLRFANLGQQDPNTGANICVPGGEGEVCSIPFDAVFELARAFGQVDLVKFDCEGAEGPIIHTSKRIGEAARVVGEWHESLDEMFQSLSHVTGVVYSPESLRGKLESLEFRVEWCPTAGSSLGLFFAEAQR